LGTDHEMLDNDVTHFFDFQISPAYLNWGETKTARIDEQFESTNCYCITNNRLKTLHTVSQNKKQLIHVYTSYRQIAV
jgi:hypothetical protein